MRNSLVIRNSISLYKLLIFVRNTLAVGYNVLHLYRIETELNLIFRNIIYPAVWYSQKFWCRSPEKLLNLSLRRFGLMLPHGKSTRQTFFPRPRWVYRYTLIITAVPSFVRHQLLPSWGHMYRSPLATPSTLKVLEELIICDKVFSQRQKLWTE